MRIYLWWSLCSLHLHACQVRVTVGDSGLCCYTCKSLVCWFMMDKSLKTTSIFHLPVILTVSVITHWSSMKNCTIFFFLSFTIFSFIAGTHPQHLSNFLQPYTPTRQLSSASNICTFVPPRVNTKTVDKTAWLKRSTTLILLFWKLPFRLACSLTISKLFHSCVYSQCPQRVGGGRYVCVSVFVRVCVRVFLVFFSSALGTCAVEGGNRDPLC